MIRRQLPAYSPLTGVGIARGMWDTLRRPETVLEELRALLVHRFRASEAYLLASGTQALQEALAMVGASASGPRVALPAYSCFDLVTAVVGADARVTFYDLDPISLTPEDASFRRALGEGVDAVVVAPLFGYPVDWDVIRDEVRAAGAVLIEDAAQGLGSSWSGRRWGSFGDLTVLSFGRGKGWTGAGGGALLVRSAGLSTEGSAGPTHTAREPSGPAPPRSSSLTTGFLAVAQWAMGRPRAYGLVTSLPGLGLGTTEYRAPTDLAGMSLLSGALVRGHAEVAEGLAEARREKARAWRSVVRDPLQPCVPLSDGACGYLRLAVRSASQRDALCRAAIRAGVAAGYPSSLPALVEELSLGTLTFGAVPTPGADELAERLLTLPTHPLVSSEDLRVVERAVG